MSDRKDSCIMFVNDSPISIILPSYKPDDKLIATVKGLKDAGFDDIIVVDDGSGEEYEKYFDKMQGEIYTG